MIRYIFGVPLAAVVTLSLFYLMRSLISAEFQEPEDQFDTVEISIAREDRDETVNIDELNPRPKKTTPPPPPPPASNRRPPPKATNPNVDVNFDLNIDGSGDFTTDSDVQPIVRVPPQYPIRALERGTEGWVLIEFTVTAEGTVIDPKIIDAEPSNTFNRAASKAVVRWKYKPMTRDGKAVAWTERVVLTFELEE